MYDLNILYLVMYVFDETSVVTVPTFLYSIPIPVKIHGSRYQLLYQSKIQKQAN